MKLGRITFYDGSFSNFIEALLESEYVRGNEVKKNIKCISPLSAHGIVESFSNRRFRLVIERKFICVPDGMPLVWLARLSGYNSQRCYGPELFKRVIIESRKLHIKHYLLGSNDDDLLKLHSVCKSDWENGNVMGFCSLPFSRISEDNLTSIAKEVNLLDIQFIWIGISTPKQEILAYRLSKYVSASAIFTVGAAFNFHTKKILTPPLYIQKVGLEWLFRTLTEPRRLFLRYLKVVPFFIIYVFFIKIKAVFHENAKCSSLWSRGIYRRTSSQKIKN